jgi:hypothetical protein
MYSVNLDFMAYKRRGKLFIRKAGIATLFSSVTPDFLFVKFDVTFSVDCIIQTHILNIQ